MESNVGTLVTSTPWNNVLPITTHCRLELVTRVNWFKSPFTKIVWLSWSMNHHQWIF